MDNDDAVNENGGINEDDMNSKDKNNKNYEDKDDENSDGMYRPEDQQDVDATQERDETNGMVFHCQ